MAAASALRRGCRTRPRRPHGAGWSATAVAVASTLLAAAGAAFAGSWRPEARHAAVPQRFAAGARSRHSGIDRPAPRRPRGGRGRGLAASRGGEATASDVDWKPFLRTLLLSRSEASRKAALKEIQAVFDGRSGEFLEEIARHGKASQQNRLFYSLRARPFFGYRSACASLHRTMVEHVLPEQEGSAVRLQKRQTEDGEQRMRYVLRDDAMEGDDSEPDDKAADAPKDEVERTGRQMAMQDETSRARALFVLLRQLPGAPAWELERAARDAKELQASPDKWLARTPDLETPKYEVLFQAPDGAYEVRRYSAYSTVETDKAKESSSGGNRQFFALANYIFGKANDRQEKMAMTTPVQTDPRTGAMSFVLPSGYWGDDSLKGAPAPTGDTAVRLVARAEETVAVTTFGGYARGPAVAQRTNAMLEALRGDARVQVPDKDATRVMQYNDPFTVPWKRRNEVAIPVNVV